MNRETITAALYSKLSVISGLRSYSRRPKTFEEVAASDCPALYLAIGESTVTKTGPGNSPLWRLTWTIYLYCWDASKAGPSSQINTYIGYVEDALEPTVAEKAATGINLTMTTLGGLVEYARLIDVQTDEGSFGDLGVAILTVEALAVG